MPAARFRRRSYEATKETCKGRRGYRVLIGCAERLHIDARNKPVGPSPPGFRTGRTSRIVLAKRSSRCNMRRCAGQQPGVTHRRCFAEPWIVDHNRTAIWRHRLAGGGERRGSPTDNRAAAHRPRAQRGVAKKSRRTARRRHGQRGALETGHIAADRKRD